MPSPKLVLAGLSLALLALPAAAQAPELSAPAWTVDPAQSRLGFSAIADGQEFAGKFNKWDAQINFDPAKLDASSAMVTIATGSVETEDSSRSATLQTADWFSAQAFPNATFRTTAIRAEGSGYVADGTLTIRDMSKEVSLPFALTIEGDVAKMNGKLVLDRKAFMIGGGYEDNHVDANVTVEVNIVAHRG